MKRLIIIMFVLILCGVTYATEYYMKTDGNDSSDGLGLETAWKTFYNSTYKLSAGDTLWVVAGTYVETSSPAIRPAGSGSSGNYITVVNYDGGEAILTDTTALQPGADLDGFDYWHIKGIIFRKAFYSITMDGSQYCIIEDCVFNDDYSVEGSPWCEIFLDGTTGNGSCDYNQIIGCTFYCNCKPDDSIYLLGNATHNLIANNTFYNANHVIIELQGDTDHNVQYNIIRNNIVENRWHSAINIYGTSNNNVISDNIVFNTGIDHLNNACGTEGDRTADDQYHWSIGIEGSGNIVRRNVVYDGGSVTFENYGDSCDNNRIYNNTFADNFYNWYTTASDQVTGNIAKNNIFSNGSIRNIHHDAQNATRLNSFINNCINTGAIYWYNDGVQTIAQMETGYPALWSGNIDDAPGFVNPSGDDYTLNTGSACIDAGTWLTTITTANGSGTAFDVDDATYFCDGNGIDTGDEYTD